MKQGIVYQVLAVLVTEALSSPDVLKAGEAPQWVPQDGEIAVRCRSSVGGQPYAGAI